MHKSLIFTALISLSGAVVLDIYDDDACTQLKTAGVNIYDNSCGSWMGGFQSYKITGDSSQAFQCLTTYSHNYCADAATSVRRAVHSGDCFTATNGAGGSNAISSYTSTGNC